MIASSPSTTRVARSIFRGVSLALLVGLAGCHRGQSGGTVASYRPDTLPYNEGVLVVAGSRLRINLSEERKPSEVVFFLKSEHGVTFEHEAYKFDSERFSLWQAGGEMYDPVIPLLVNPVRAGSKWTWKGKMTLAADGVPSTSEFGTSPATAEIATSPDKLNMRTGAVEAMRVDVMLSLESGTPTPALRKLSFWFVNGQGMIKREFAAASTRLPDEGDSE